MPLVGETGYDITDPLAAYNPHGPDAVIDPDVLWSCTTCGACVEQCPVDIEHVDAIVDMRRYQVLIESAFPAELGGLFKNLENKSNPWGMAARARLDWAKDLPFEVNGRRPGRRGRLTEVDYLFWVGCAGAYEDRAKKTTRAVAELLRHRRASASPCSATASRCTGDPARRAGNEFLFQMLAQQNVETLNEVGATKIVVTCAHCFNTIKNEYPQLGGSYEVVHHTQLLNRLVREKRLVPVARPDRRRHHRGGLDRADGDLPRPVLPRPAQRGLRPAARAARRAARRRAARDGAHRARSPSAAAPAAPACGWRRSSAPGSTSNRTDEAVATGADRIAIGCPFCRVMLSDGLGGHAVRRRRPARRSRSSTSPRCCSPPCDSRRPALLADRRFVRLGYGIRCGPEHEPEWLAGVAAVGWLHLQPDAQSRTERRSSNRLSRATAAPAITGRSTVGDGSGAEAVRVVNGA